MSEIELLRSPSERRRYILGDLGSLRLNGWFMRSATVETRERSFTVEKTRSLTTAVAASDSHRELGAFQGRTLRAGGRLRWLEDDYVLRHEKLFGESYALMRGDDRLALVTARGWWGWGVKRPLTMEVWDATDAGLLLFVAFVVRSLANQRAADASAASTAATTSTYTG